MKRLRKLSVTAITIFIILLFVYNTYNFICLKILKKDLISLNGYAILEVISGSMEPTIKIGDLIVINVNEKTYKKGDIVTFYDEENSFVTHRIISIDNTKKEMVTKGDNNNADDGPTKTTKIVGKYICKFSGLGKILSTLRSPFVMFIIFITSFLACITISMEKTPKIDTNQEDYQEFQAYLKSKKSSNIETINEIEKNLKATTGKDKRKNNNKKKKKRAKRKKQRR